MFAVYVLQLKATAVVFPPALYAKVEKQQIWNCFLGWETDNI